MKKILILGGFGFLGKNINEVFKDLKYELFNESKRTGCDLLNFQNLKNKIETIKPDYIINAAAHVGSMDYVAKKCADVCHDNSLMYINLYSAVKEVDSNILIINPISNCSYPGIIDIQNEENWWDGVIHQSVESYGNPKKLGYILSETYKKQYGIKTINLILANAYGPLDYTDVNKTHALNGLIIRMIESKRRGDKEFVVWGTGTPIREWLYMEDAARLIKEIIDNDITDLPNPLNFGKQNGVSIIDSVNTIKSIMGYDVEIVNDLTKQDGAPIKILGNSKFKQNFSDFVFTDYIEGIKKTIEYYERTI
jgi:GDP-L-fucose synthase